MSFMYRSKASWRWTGWFSCVQWDKISAAFAASGLVEERSCVMANLGNVGCKV
jgi:hypothetical protein